MQTCGMRCRASWRARLSRRRSQQGAAPPAARAAGASPARSRSQVPSAEQTSNRPYDNMLVLLLLLHGLEFRESRKP